MLTRHTKHMVNHSQEGAGPGPVWHDAPRHRQEDRREAGDEEHLKAQAHNARGHCRCAARGAGEPLDFKKLCMGVSLHGAGWGARRPRAPQTCSGCAGAQRHSNFTARYGLEPAWGLHWAAWDRMGPAWVACWAAWGRTGSETGVGWLIICMPPPPPTPRSCTTWRGTLM